MSVQTPTNETVSTDGAQIDELDDRDIKALLNPMTVIDSAGDVADDDALFEVTTESEYVVNNEAKTCECPDHQYRGVRCYHIRRVEFETGERAIPGWVSLETVDDQLGMHIESGEPRIAMTDGGVAAHQPSSERKDPRDDYILIGVDADGAHHIYRTKDEHVLVVADGEVTQNYDLEAHDATVNDWIDYVETKIYGGFESQCLFKTMGDWVSEAI